MSKSVVVLAVPHQLQGQGFKGYIVNQTYSDLVASYIGDGVDFVFEEAAGQAPSIAANLAESLLGPNRYMDIDPPPQERDKYHIAVKTGGGDWLEPGVSEEICEWAIVEENRKREALWTQRVKDQPFTKGLAICGIAHGLSFAFRLSSAGINVEKSYSYIPHRKLAKLA